LGTLRVRTAPGVGVEVDAEVVYVAPLPDGPIMVLEGIAALIWTVSDGVERAAVAGFVAQATGEEVSAVRSHVDAFIDEMLDRRMLVQD